MICPHCGQHITVNDSQVVNPAAANPTVTLYPPVNLNAAAPAPTFVLYNFTAGG